MIEALRRKARGYLPWVEFQELRREGFRQAWRRRSVQQQILQTAPVRTAQHGNIEVRVMTWRRDWINVIWALKSFYHFARVDHPLYIHDGGLKPEQFGILQQHFPNATIISSAAASEEVLPELKKRKLERCLAYRPTSPFGPRVMDFYLLSKADAVITIDADVLFFREPNELTGAIAEVTRKNKFNQDIDYCYSLSLEEMEASFGIKPVAFINAGLSFVWVESVDFELMNEWLGHPKLFAEKWLTEQTLHALFSTRYGVELLPRKYDLGTTAGIRPDAVTKHYPGFIRDLFYHEGMQSLIDAGFLQKTSL